MLHLVRNQFNWLSAYTQLTAVETLVGLDILKRCFTTQDLVHVRQVPLVALMLASLPFSSINWENSRAQCLLQGHQRALPTPWAMVKPGLEKTCVPRRHLFSQSQLLPEVQLREALSLPFLSLLSEVTYSGKALKQNICTSQELEGPARPRLQQPYGFPADS